MKVCPAGIAGVLRHPNRPRKGAAQLKGIEILDNDSVAIHLTAPERGRHN